MTGISASEKLQRLACTLAELSRLKAHKQSLTHQQTTAGNDQSKVENEKKQQSLHAELEDLKNANRLLVEKHQQLMEKFRRIHQQLDRLHQKK